MKRRDFNQLIALGTLGLAYSSPTYNKKISLAQWSLHRTIKIKKELSPNDFSIKLEKWDLMQLNMFHLFIGMN